MVSWKEPAGRTGSGQCVVRLKPAAPYGWITQKSNFDNLNTLRSNVRRWRLLHRALA